MEELLLANTEYFKYYRYVLLCSGGYIWLESRWEIGNSNTVAPLHHLCGAQAKRCQQYTMAALISWIFWLPSLSLP